MGDLEDTDSHEQKDEEPYHTIKYNGEEYEVTFYKSYDTNPGYEHRELLNVEKAGVSIPPEDPIWKEIQNHLGEEVTAK